MLRTRRLIVAVPIVELLCVIGMVVPAGLAFVLFDATVTARILEMQRLALWTAPTAGFVFCLLGGWWVARRPQAGEERNGLLLGVAVAAIDLALLIAAGAPLGALMVVSVVGRLAGGYCGGVLAARASGTAIAPA